MIESKATGVCFTKEQRALTLAPRTLTLVNSEDWLLNKVLLTLVNSEDWLLNKVLFTAQLWLIKNKWRLKKFPNYAAVKLWQVLLGSATQGFSSSSKKEAQ